MRNPPIAGRPQDSGTLRTIYGNYGGRNYHKHNHHKLHDLQVLKRIADRVLETAKKSVVGGGVEVHHCNLTSWQQFCAITTPRSTSIAMPPRYIVPEGKLIVN